MNPNHIVFFTQLYYPDMTTTAIIMTDLVEDLAAYGMDVKVVCAQPTYIKNSDPQITPVRSSGPTGQAQINADLKKMKDQRTQIKIEELRNLGIKTNSGIEEFRDKWHG